VTADLTTLGKVIGGGLPVGAYGGRADLMNRMAPVGPVYQAGTLSGNPLATAAGLATLALVQQPGFYERLEASAGTLMAGLQAIADAAGVPFSTVHVGGMFGFFLRDTPPRDLTEAQQADVARFGRLFRALLEAGVSMAPSAFEAGFVSAAHDQGIIDQTLEAARRAFAGL
jgi:glutamate-1-semialdehyde 2,1-aminomutase